MTFDPEDEFKEHIAGRHAGETVEDEIETIPVTASGGYDKANETYQATFEVPGLTVFVSVKPEGFGSLAAVLTALPDVVPDIIQQVIDAQEAEDQVESIAMMSRPVIQSTIVDNG